MKHGLIIKVDKKAPNDGIVAIRKKTVREKVLRRLLGSPIKMTVLVPGDNVGEVEIRDIREGGERYEPRAASV